LRALLAVVVSVSFVAVAAAQTSGTNAPRDGVDFRVQVWGDAVADFSMRVERYLDLRRALERGLPPLVLTDNPDEIITAEETLARAIRQARVAAKEGDILTPAISKAFRDALRPLMTGETLAVIMDENPGRFSHHINGTFPKTKSRATIPWSILAVLPPLPDDIQYGFVGRYLILHDIRANVIVDRMACAIRCGD